MNGEHRPTSPEAIATPEDPVEVLRRLPSMPIEERRMALEPLIRNTSISVRQRALAMGAILLPEEQLVSYLRQEGDDVLRNAGLEILKARGHRSYSLAVRLIEDADSDVVLQAVLVLDHLRDPRALDPFRQVLDHADINVVQAALLGLGRLGDPRALPDILRFLDGDPWLQMAAIRALGHLRSPRAVSHLEKLLPDLLLGPLAAEALAQIGGPKALAVLARHWVELREEIESEVFLGHLAATASTMKRPPSLPPGARESIAQELDSPSEAVRTAAAQCLLALGPGTSDEAALRILVAASYESSHLPECLENRPDLALRLLAGNGTEQAWGLRLAHLGRIAVPSASLFALLGGTSNRIVVELAAGLLEKCREKELGEPLLSALAAIPSDLRPLLAPAIARHRPDLRKALARRTDLDDEVRLAASLMVGGAAAAVAQQLAAIPEESRLHLLPLAASQPKVLRLLPWESWIAEKPQEYAGAAAMAVQHGGLHELVGLLRRRLEEGSEPDPALVRALGELRDRDSARPMVAWLAKTAAPRLRAQLLESLGRIGGPEARQALREVAATSPIAEARVAYRSLSLCATEEDSPFFRQAAGHADWAIRLACVEALGRSREAEDWPVLVSLAADPVAAVSHKAMACLQP